MTRHEKQWLLVGLVSSALVAGAVGFGLFYKSQRNQIPATTQASPMREPAAVSQPAPSSNTARAVQLSSDEQTKIGIRIAEVQRESITEDILAIGRVEEPETSVATI